MTSAADTPYEPRTDRRDALKKLGAGAALAWTTPLILQSAASAASGSCYPQSVVWKDNPTIQPGPTSMGGFTPFPFVLGSVDVVVPDYAGPVFPPDPPIDVIWNDQALGGAAADDQLTINLQATAIGDFHDVELDFGTTQVFGLTFTIYDIDTEVLAWQDRVGVYVQNDVTAVPYVVGTNPGDYTVANLATVADTNGIGTGPGGAPNGIIFTAIPGGTPSPVPNGDTDGNVTISLPQNIGITKVTLRYEAAGEGTQPQQIGISDLEFCAFIT